ncbi:uncharacterized protein FTOL_01220 [Fusarium torulosum]|uniref:Uncharacterized protein n=1 Tax=Fusarium torulosum TaxID=33205 RepID=A0AAE8SDF6_9HYPO|nr:uncharacterized protein FTOL_01220 [Fusarium torulosum]
MPEVCVRLSDMVTSDPEAKELLKLIPTMPSITDLQLVDTDLSACCRQTNGLIKFIGRHSKTLKRIYLISVCIRKWILPKLAVTEALKELELFVVVSKLDIDEDKAEHISEQRALDYINGKNNAQTPYDQRDRETELHTHEAISNVDTWQTAALDEHGIAYDIGARWIKDPVTSLWSDSNGVFYNPATDTELDDPEGKSYEPEDDTRITQGQRSWNPELGLWRDGITGRLKRFAIDRETLDKPDGPDRDDRELQSNASESDKGSESSALHFFNAGEEEEYYLRAEMAPRWDRGRDATGQVWFWNEPESTAEATPYGWNLLYFVAQTNEVVGSEIPQPGSCDSLTLHKYEDNPMWDEREFDEVGMYELLPPPADFERHSKKGWTDGLNECLGLDRRRPDIEASRQMEPNSSAQQRQPLR